VSKNNNASFIPITGNPEALIIDLHNLVLIRLDQYGVIMLPEKALNVNPS
jgi:hypothetical protein